MVTKQELFYNSRDNATKIHAVKWIPTGKPKAILQISHGMLEYIERYDEFATYLADRGYLVLGNDHLGHGKSVKSPEDYGYFSEKDGNTIVVRDIHRLKKMTQEEYIGVPYFLLGHSMGSFLARQYIIRYGTGIDGAIIVGTGDKSNFIINTGLLITSFLKTLKGGHYKSKMVKNISFMGYNNHFEPKRTANDWLTRDESIVDKYENDKFCKFDFTVNAYNNMFKGMKFIKPDNNLNQMPKNLPILFAAGQEDPVGGYGKEVTAVYNKFKEIGMQNITLKLYKDDRHEIINELDRESVYEDIYNWLEEKITNK